MKKVLAIMLSLSLCISLSACMGGEIGDTASHDTTEVFQVGDYPVFITTPKGWTQEDMESFDLQCLSHKDEMYMSVYGYHAIDFAEDQTTQELFELQNNQVMSLRDNNEAFSGASY